MGHSWSRTDRLLRLAKLRGDRAAELIQSARAIRERATAIAATIDNDSPEAPGHWDGLTAWTEAELRAAWGDR